MPEKKRLRFERQRETLTIFRRSLIYQTKEFFENSTLHGVRYIAETGRPIGEKFMWFCFTSIGAVTALVIIMSLWEKFQTNPTITGLDTDFHNQNIVFPTTVVCPDAPFDAEQAFHVAFSSLANYDHGIAAMTAPFLEALTSLSFENIKDAYMLGQSIPEEAWNDESLRQWAFKAQMPCENTLVECKYRDEVIKCCSHFDVVYTEHGFCFAFNSRYKSTPLIDQKQVSPHDLYETDKKWALFFIPNVTSKIFIFSYEEYFGKDFSAQIEFEIDKKVEVRISKKNTYTTDDARQLTIGQRKCIFHDEVKLKYFPDDYTFSSCMKECRIKKAIKLCKCTPPFYKPVSTVPICKVDQLVCLDEYKMNITNIKECLHCELSCSKTVFTIEKLSKLLGTDASDPGVSVEFLTWPIIRYKREVLFGWVDLLVSFGGIASLFLGFSLLSGVEIIYYFTLRACCMVYKNRQELYEIEEEIKRKPPPLINLSLKMKYQHNTCNINSSNIINNNIDAVATNNLNSGKMLNTRHNLPLNVLPTVNGTGATMELGRRRRAEKDYNMYSKMMYKPVKDANSNNLPYGHYLP